MTTFEERGAVPTFRDDALGNTTPSVSPSNSIGPHAKSAQTGRMISPLLTR